MKKIVSSIILLGCLSSVFAATWHYDTDGCTKVYAYGSDSSECFDKRREILKEAGRNLICKYGYCF
ncbi:hypothetical protein [Campylobacter helveticus]|uniref:Uncharacterized protein n=1 Tax=Campylobacter helveticus TaxID=28898 RepID=A0AAX2UHL6_9BACT|nr:hypothetical protein [Campylobacter helveticus]ARE81167.1 hypothetical protein CHELV3228_1601 [Campylobacter helveticus]MCR2040108.1 hypothetical protein [Campylobacter helveticus]MCR2055147.1 hypothetical protein [Campylobacter helveticus]MCR2057288.1 hypothetical protein [Campylobacter helveticus]MCR2059510.1 hypothetical protein [Campylobacter helveticus]